MTRITNADQVLMLLRAHLERAGKKRAGQTNTTQKSSALGPVARVKALANTSDSLSLSDLSRALIAGLLTEEFGAEIASDARFQSIVEDVRLAFESTTEGRNLMEKAIKQLIKG